MNKQMHYCSGSQLLLPHTPHLPIIRISLFPSSQNRPTQKVYFPNNIYIIDIEIVFFYISTYIYSFLIYTLTARNIAALLSAERANSITIKYVVKF